MTAAMLIPEGTNVEGTVETPGDLRIEGTCDGSIDIGGEFVVGKGSTCRVEVRARRATVYGRLIGSIICSERITLEAGARVVGDLRAPDISVDSLAKVDGRVDLLPPEPENAPVQRVQIDVRGLPVPRPLPPHRDAETKGSVDDAPEATAEFDADDPTRNLHESGTPDPQR